MKTILLVLGILVVFTLIVAYKSRNQVNPQKKVCGCGRTKDSEGACDGSHNNPPPPSPTPDINY